MLICPQCSAANPLDSARCLRCGLSLADAIGAEGDPEDAATVAMIGGELRSPSTYLVLTLGRDIVRELRSERPMINIGREATQDLPIENGAISRQHCRVCYEGGRYWLRDLGSENGVELNGRRVQSAELRPGDQVGLGKYTIFFEPSAETLALLEYPARPTVARSEDEEGETAHLRHREREQVRREREARQAPHLRRLDERGRALERYPLDREVVLGSSPNAAVPVEGWFVRPEQALIDTVEGAFQLRALGGLRRVYVNGARVAKRRLRNHDRIKVGISEFRFYDKV